MENDILDSLSDLGYEGPLADETVFAKALDGGPKSLEFTKLVHILAEEIKKLCDLEETVNIMNNPDESSAFLLELSSFLKELGCPYKKLVTGHMSSRLQNKEDRILLLDYMLSELMAARMVNVDHPKDKPRSGMEIVMQESPTAKDLKEILIALKFNKPPPNITAELLFSKLEAKLKDTLQKEGEQLVGKPLYNKALSESDWKQLDTMFTEMFEEYRLRRETLITRLECTIQSFEWSDRLKEKKDLIQSTYRPKREQLKVKPDVKLSDFLAARTSLQQVEKTSSASVRKNTQTEVNKVIIGQVPDRGGRPNEQQPPPPEMPSWQQRSNVQQVCTAQIQKPSLLGHNVCQRNQVSAQKAETEAHSAKTTVADRGSGSELKPDCQLLPLKEGGDSCPGGSKEPATVADDPGSARLRPFSDRDRDSGGVLTGGSDSNWSCPTADPKGGTVAKEKRSDADLNQKRETKAAKRRRRLLRKQLATQVALREVTKRAREDSVTDNSDVKRVKTHNALTGVKMALVSEDFPATSIEPSMFGAIQGVIWDLLENTPDPLPIININYVIAGAVHVTCASMSAVDWLGRLNGVTVANLRLKVIDAKDITPVKMAWKSKNVGCVDTTRVLEMLQRLNPSLQTSEWKVVNTLVEGTHTRRIVYMDRKSAHVIKAAGYCLRAGIDNSVFKLLEDSH